MRPPSIVDLSLLRRVLIRENLVQECTGGAAGIEVSRGTQCQMENNEVVKGDAEGIRVVGDPQAPRMVFIKNTLCKENAGSGFLVRGVREGGVIMQDCIMSQNSIHGI